MKGYFITKERLAIVFTLIAALYSVFLTIDQRYALASSVEKVTQKVERIELRSALSRALEDMYFYRSQVRKYPQDQELKNKAQTTETEVQILKDELSRLKEKSQ